MTFSRYAIFHTPAPGPFASFATAWLGWDPATGRSTPPPAVKGLPLPLSEITATPRKYGLHGTIKAPFSLAHGLTEAGLSRALAGFCARQRPVVLDRLELAQLGRFLALMPVGDTTALQALAANAVQSLDHFRAPLTEAQLARRRTNTLSPGQEAMLVQWGYPYVMAEFRFHLTLTGKLPKAKTAQVHHLLAPHLTPLLPAPYCIDGLSLMGEDDEGLFHLIRHIGFGGS